MRLSSSFQQRLRDNRVLFLLLSLTLLFLTVSYYAVLRGRELDPASINSRILLFTLRNANVVLVLAVGFVLVRNLVKLWVERRHKKLGAQFKTKLVATYIGLSLLPVLLLFAYANRVVQGSLDTLFDPPGGDVLAAGNGVSQALTLEHQERNVRSARAALAATRRVTFADPEQRPRLSRVLQNEMARQGVDLVVAYEDTEFVHASLNPRSGVTQLPELDRDFLVDALRDGEAADVVEIPERQERWILGAATRPGEAGGPREVVVSGTVIPADLASQTELLVHAFQANRQLKAQEDDIRTISLLLLLMVTLVLLLVCTWVGLILARRVTVPIEALAEGTRRIISGDLDHRVDVEADDELGVLVDSFNRMTSELQRNEELIAKSHRELTASNRELAEERALIGAVLDNVAAGVVSFDDAGVVLTVNAAALRMLLLREEQVLGRRLEELVAEQPQLRALLSEPPSGRGSIAREVRLSLGAEWKTFEIKSAPLPGAHGGGMVLVLEDLTELIRAQKQATWNEAARRIAHEIKNPLTPIQLAAERLLRKHRAGDPELGDALENAVQIIVREVGTMKSLVDEFARFARMPRPRPVAVDLHRLVGETVHLYRDIKPGVEVTTSVDLSVLLASLDPEQFRGVLVNLLDNAVEATTPPGHVEVRAERCDGLLSIRVSDTGAGIPPEDKEKLFLPYYSTKGRGTGLGLAIVHRIVTDHHGTIRVEDNHPRGTVFTIEIPQAP
ncbi:MAG TPA: ATP-binding protein [Thermoanaerobaculia bacterium]|nr:ATP-binding protein [Thermoanaerobaculia bacterium]